MISSATNEPFEPSEIIDQSTDVATTDQQDPANDQESEHVVSVSDHQEHDLTDLYDRIAEPQDEPDPPDTSPSPRYNLRPRRSRLDALTDDQRFRDYEVGLHISVPKARELYGEVAEESMLNELTKLHRKNTMVPIDPRSLTRERRRNVITSKMLLKEKFLSTGEFDKLKSRLVAGGHRQDRRQYEEWEITSPHCVHGIGLYDLSYSSDGTATSDDNRRRKRISQCQHEP